MAEMRINYELTIEKANRIKELAERVRMVADNVKNAEDDTIPVWQGYAADTYRSQCEALENEFYKIEMKMNKLSESIIRTANTIKEADERIAAATSALET